MLSGLAGFPGRAQHWPRLYCPWLLCTAFVPTFPSHVLYCTVHIKTARRAFCEVREAGRLCVGNDTDEPGSDSSSSSPRLIQSRRSHGCTVCERFEYSVASHQSAPREAGARTPPVWASGRDAQLLDPNSPVLSAARYRRLPAAAADLGVSKAWDADAPIGCLPFAHAPRWGSTAILTLLAMPSRAPPNGTMSLLEPTAPPLLLPALLLEQPIAANASLPPLAPLGASLALPRAA